MQDFDGAVLIVSHDRHLLDETVTQIAELEGGRIRVWQGGYSAYAVARELELVRRQQQYVTQQKEIARLEEAIRRFKDWAHRVVDERHIKRARNAQRHIDRMEKVERPVFERRKMALALRSEARGGDRVIALRGVDFAPVLNGVELEIVRGERVGIVGPIGAGKTRARAAARRRPAADRGRRAGPARRSPWTTSARPRPSCPATARRSTSCARRGRSARARPCRCSCASSSTTSSCAARSRR